MCGGSVLRVEQRGSCPDVWYVSYGSNMSAARLASYLEGGRPPGGSRAQPRGPGPDPAGPQHPRRPARVAVLRRGVAAVGRRSRLLRPRHPGLHRGPRLPGDRRPVRRHRRPGDAPGAAGGRPDRGGRARPARRRPAHRGTGALRDARRGGAPRGRAAADLHRTPRPRPRRRTRTPRRPTWRRIGLGLRESRGWGEDEVAEYFASVLPSVPAPRTGEEFSRRGVVR